MRERIAMDVKDAIEERRALRTMGPLEVTAEMVEELARSAQLAPSCSDNQPWRFVFVYDGEPLDGVRGALSRGNAWALKAPLYVVVFSREDLDCVLSGGERVYNWLDTGIAVGNMLLRATELGLATHPIAGFDPVRVREVTGIPDDMTVPALIVVGMRVDGVDPDLNDRQREHELHRPSRKPLEDFAFHNRYAEKGGKG